MLQGHALRVNDLSFAPDGGSLVSCSTDGTVRLWDTATGEMSMLAQIGQRQEFERRRNTSAGFDRIAFTGNGHSVVGRSATDGLHVHDLVYPGPLVLLRRTVRTCECGLAVTWAGGLVAANDWIPEPYQDVVRLWDGTWKEHVLHVATDTTSLSGLAFDPSGKRLATNVGVFEVATGERPLDVLLAGDVMQWSPTEPLLACGEAGEGIEVLNADTGDPVVSLPIAEKGVPQFGFSPDGRYLAAIISETVCVWETRNWAKVRASSRGKLVGLPVWPFRPTDCSRRVGTRGARFSSGTGICEVARRCADRGRGDHDSAHASASEPALW